MEENQEKDVFEELEEETPAKQKRGGIKIVSGEEEKQGEKERIKKVIVAKAVEAAKKDEEILPGLEKEEGIREEGAKAKQEEEEKQATAITPELSFLRAGKEGVFIGRKKSVFEKYGMDAALFVGKVQEEKFRGENVFLDGLNPHVVFVCGSRGSGKSYLIGVMAEELAMKNKNVGVVVIDPIGVFWSMRYPNKEEREIELLGKWQLLPQGLSNVKVFIPEGMKEKVPKTTFDATFSLQATLLTTDDWCLTFGIDRFSPTGLLLEKALQKMRQGYKTTNGKEVKGKQENYSLEDLIECLVRDSEINSPEKGYKQDSIRALASRFDAAKAWGVFSISGTALTEICSEAQLAIIDTSFLDENVSALVIGIIARRILAARKLSTRREAAEKLKKEEINILEADIPPTWLLLDEAHTLIPSGNVRTPASNALVEYVKQGRQPGCSLVFATQQPSAIDTRVLSQIDTIFTHKLVFDDDIKAVFKRTPTIMPRAFKQTSFIKTLPIGVAVTGDRVDETSRAFVMKTRPRMSQHEGRESVTTETKRELDEKQVKKLATEMAFAQLERLGSMEEKQFTAIVQKLNEKYGTKIQAIDVIAALEKRGAIVNPKTMLVNLAKKEEIVEELGREQEAIAVETASTLAEKTQLLAFPDRIGKNQAMRVFNSFRKKKLFGFFGEEETIESITLKYLPVYKVYYNYFDSKNTFKQGETFIDSYSGEFLQFDEQQERFVSSRGLKELSNLTEVEVKVLLAIGSNKIEHEAVEKRAGEAKPRFERAIKGLLEKQVIEVEEISSHLFYFVKKSFDLPPNPLHPFLESLNKLAVTEVEALALQKEVVEKAKIVESMKKLWRKLVVTGIKHVYLPFYEAVLKKPNGSHRRIWIEAVTGKEMEFIE